MPAFEATPRLFYWGRLAMSLSSIYQFPPRSFILQYLFALHGKPVLTHGQAIKIKTDAQGIHALLKDNMFWFPNKQPTHLLIQRGKLRGQEKMI